MVDVILGLQWGDEGKGKIVDYFAPRYDMIARFQGGPNAGHTLYVNNKKVVLHQIPSGIFHENAINLMKNPLMAIVKMSGVPKSPDPSSMATVYWDTKSKEVYLLVNQLPKPVANKQYQLWAIVDGKPVDVGIFDSVEGLSFVKLKTIQKAEAFAITLEKKGGSATPDMEAMYVMGKVTG